MMEGTYYKEWSAVLDREMEFKVYGHGGVPVLALPPGAAASTTGRTTGCPTQRPVCCTRQNPALLRRQHRRREPAGGQ